MLEKWQQAGRACHEWLWACVTIMFWVLGLDLEGTVKAMGMETEQATELDPGAHTCLRSLVWRGIHQVLSQAPEHRRACTLHTDWCG